MRQAFRILKVAAIAVVAGAALTACKSKPVEETPDAGIEPPPVVQPTTTPAPPPPKRIDREGNPIDASGNPLGRTFYFGFDQARLSEADLRVLAMHASFLRDFRDRSVRIEGHCDERGTREYNLGLGERRAQAVQRYLTSAGVRASQIELISFGEEQPADPGSSESAWAKNRRAVLMYR